VSGADRPPAPTPRNALPIQGVLVSIAVALGLAYALRSIAAPFFTALLLIALVDGMVGMLARTWPSGPRWTLILAAAVILVLLLGASVAALSVGIGRIVADAPALSARIDHLIVDIAHWVRVPDPPRLSELIGGDWIVGVITPVLSGVGDLASAATLTALFFGFMLASRPMLERKLAILAGSAERSKQFRLVLDRITRSAGTYMWVQTVSGALYALASGAVFMAIGLDNALFWTVLVFLLSYIPILGVVVASIAPALFALVQFETYWQAIAVFGAVQVFASLVGNILLPRMQAEEQNIDPTVSLIAVALWTLLWGVAGAFLAIPLAVLAMIVFDQFEETRWAAILISNDGTPEGPAPTNDEPAPPT